MILLIFGLSNLYTPVAKVIIDHSTVTYEVFKLGNLNMRSRAIFPFLNRLLVASLLFIVVVAAVAITIFVSQKAQDVGQSAAPRPNHIKRPNPIPRENQHQKRTPWEINRLPQHTTDAKT